MTTGQHNPIISYSHYYYSDNLQSPMDPSSNKIHSLQMEKALTCSSQTATRNVPGDRGMVGGLKHFSPAKQHVFHQTKYIWKAKSTVFTNSLQLRSITLTASVRYTAAGCLLFSISLFYFLVFISLEIKLK